MKKFFAATVLAGLLSAVAATALAQDQEQPDQDRGPLKDRESFLILGLGVGYAPVYAGDDEYEAKPLPSINARYDRFFINTQGFGIANSGIGYQLYKGEYVTAGPLVNLDLGRNEGDSSDLRGLGDIGVSGLAGAFMDVDYENWRLSLVGLGAFAGDTDGYGARISLGYQIPLSRKLFVNPVIGTTWASSDYTNSYFGVTSQQSANSGYQQYNAGSGFMDFSAGINARYFIDENWALLGLANVKTYGSHIADSPLVKENGSRTSGFVGASVLYVF
ncbi:MipA/OmpV family protein [Rhodovibrionaceae bacterium A322]